MRVLCAAAISLSLGLLVAFADEKSDRAAKLADVKKKYEAENKELLERFRNATPAEQAGIRTELRELAAITAGKVLKIAEENPKDEVGLDALTYILKMSGQTGAGGADVEKAVGLLTEHHADSPKVKDYLIPAMRMGPVGEKFLKAVSEKNTDKEAKGTALFIRAYLLSQKLDEEENEAKQAVIVKEATALFEEAAKVAPDVKLGGRTIADFAKSEIESLKAVLSLGIGKPAPEITSKTLDDKAVKLSDYKGKVILLDIWATWCGPCRAMIPHERDLVKKMKDKPFVLISVSADDKKETLQKFLEKEEMPWVHWWDEGPKSQVLSKYRVQAFPTLYIIDHTGVIRHKWVGNPGNDKIDAAIEELVKEAIKAKG